MMTGFEAILLVGASTVVALLGAYFIPADKRLNGLRAPPSFVARPFTRSSRQSTAEKLAPMPRTR